MNDLTTLQSSLSAMEAQLAAVIAEKTTVLSLIATNDGASPYFADATSKSLSGRAGSYSLSYVSLNEKLRTLIDLERMLVDSIRSLKILCAESGPGVYRAYNNFCYRGF